MLTAFDLEWNRFPDPEVVRLCLGRFDVLITTDRGFEFEHNLAKLSFGILILHVLKNKLRYYRAIEDEIADAIGRVTPAQVIHVGG